MKSVTVEVFVLIACAMLVAAEAKHIKKFTKGLSQERIVGGTIAEPSLAPYQVSLQKNGRHACGGAIIHANWILTAAHCVDGTKPETLTVFTGTQDLTQPGVLYYVRQSYIHCSYDDPRSHNDIALLRLNSSIILNEQTQVIDLPTRPLNHGDALLLTGWGSEEPYGATEDHLMKIELLFMDYKRCREALNYDRDLDVGHICSFTKRGEGACHGDSGGPLVSNGTLVGIVNWGYPCAVGYPDVYASVYFYSDWIRTVMSENVRCSNSPTQCP